MLWKSNGKMCEFKVGVEERELADFTDTYGDKDFHNNGDATSTW